jgi:hypothetical protein
MTLHDAEDHELRRELEQAAHNLLSEALNARYRVDNALSVLQVSINRIMGDTTMMEATTQNISRIVGAISDVRAELERAIDYIYQAAHTIERVV